MNESLREALLERHSGSTRTLNAIRRSALPHPRLGLGDFLRELYLPARRAWILLALAWLLIGSIRVLILPSPAPIEGQKDASALLASLPLHQFDEILHRTGTTR